MGAFPTGFSQISLCKPAQSHSDKSVIKNQKCCRQKLSSGRKEEAGFSGFNFCAVSFLYLAAEKNFFASGDQPVSICWLRSERPQRQSSKEVTVDLISAGYRFSVPNILR